MLTVDAHIDLPWIHTKRGYVDFNIEQAPDSGRAVDLPRMKRGGLDAFFAALYLPDSMQDRMTNDEAQAELAAQWFNLRQGPFIIVDSKLGAFEAFDNDAVPVFLGLEGGRLIGENLINLNLWANRGVKYLTLTHNRNTSWANSATDVPQDDALTSFGVEVLKRCDDLGIWIDVSHAHDTTIEAAIHYVSGRLVATHSGVRELVDHPRNLPDWAIDELDMIGVPYARKFIGGYMVAAHIDYICQLVGTHTKVGIGSDLDGAPMIYDCPDVSKWNHWMDDLSHMGYSDNQIADIAGNNWLRLL